MKKFTLLLALFAFVLAGVSQAQNLKGSGEVFYTNTFDWEDPDNQRGWSAPEGYTFEDPTDNGFNWHWYPNDSLVAQWTAEPPFRSLTPDDGHLCLFANLYNNYMDPRIPLDNSIMFPPFDCSEHGTVILRFLTSFMNYSGGTQLVEVSTDGLRWAIFDAGFGTGHKDRPNDVAPGEPAVFQANISDVAAGAPEVWIKITWRDTDMYYWIIDDLTLSEAWDNDLQLQHINLGWDDGDDNTEESFTAYWPKSQLAGNSLYAFESSVLNFGQFEQNDVALTVDVLKGGTSVYTETSDPNWLDPLWVDSAWLEGSYTPEEFGHYEVKFTWNQAEEDQVLDNNTQSVFFHVTDSVYSRADDSAELAWSYGYERYTYGFGEDFWNIGHFAGMRFPIYEDCEVDGVSAYIMGGLADDSIYFRYALYWLPPPEEDPDGIGAIEWLTTEMIALDSSMFNTWVYLPFDKDGESEFLQAGDMVYAGVQYDNYHYHELVRRNKNLYIGADKTSPMKDPRSIGWTPEVDWDTGDFIGTRNLMVKLFINNHENIIDNVDLTTAASHLGQNYPNPFNHSTEISYELAAAQQVSIEVKDMTGRAVRVIDAGHKPAGVHTFTLNATDLEAGIYFYTLKAGQYEETKRMIVSK